MSEFTEWLESCLKVEWVRKNGEYVAAIHEAGHCVVHHLLGTTVIFATIRPQVGSPWEGMVEVVHSNDELDDDANLIVGCFAGPWAQKLFSGQPLFKGDADQDHETIDRTLDSMLGRYRLDDPERVALREKLKLRSREIVKANEERIRALAAHLIECGYLGVPWDGGAKATETLNVLVGSCSESSLSSKEKRVESDSGGEDRASQASAEVRDQ